MHPTRAPHSVYSDRYFRYGRTLAGVLLPRPDALRVYAHAPVEAHMPVYADRRALPPFVVSPDNGFRLLGSDEMRYRSVDCAMITYSVPNEADAKCLDSFRFVDGFGCRKNVANKVARISVAESADETVVYHFGSSPDTRETPSSSKSFNAYFGGRMCSEDAPERFRIQDTRFWDVENAYVDHSECEEVAYCHIEPYPIADMPALVYLEPLLESRGGKKKKKKKKRKLSQSEHQKVMRIMIGYTLGFFVVAIATFYVVYFF